MQVKHRVVVVRQEEYGEVRETVSGWITPYEAELLSDKEAERVADDPTRYVTIEANKPSKSEEVESCPI
mgnify:CR=1 FL=1